jgi:tripartite-type tricarboxylate transporter receptor subunit TctC
MIQVRSSDATAVDASVVRRFFSVLIVKGLLGGGLRCAARAVVAACAASGLVGLLSTSAEADNYPTRPITLVVPSSAGGPADVAARLITERMSAILGQPIIIEMVPGAGGTMGMSRVARAQPDGYTLMIHQTGHAIAPALYKRLPFDTARDFVAIGLVNDSRNFFIGRQSLTTKDFGELVAWMKGPGKPVKMAHPGMGSMGHLQSVTLVRLLGIEAALVPYRGVAPAVNDLLGGHVDVVEVATPVAAPHIAAGAVKGYATTAERRNPRFPDVPTYGELGLPQLQRPFWHALFAPATTPRPIVEKVNAALRATLSDPQVLKSYETTGVAAFPADHLSIEHANEFVRREIGYFGKLVRENNVQVDDP